MLALVLAAAALSGGPSHPPLRPAEVAGVYKRRFLDALADGEEFTAEDVLEVAPTGPAAAYVRAELTFGNGHTCSIASVFHMEGGALVYHDLQPPLAGRPPCVLRLRRVKARIEFDDGDGSCSTDCGERGAWQGEGFALSKRRPMRYLPRLLASREYKAALAQDAARKTPHR